MLEPSVMKLGMYIMSPEVMVMVQLTTPLVSNINTTASQIVESFAPTCLIRYSVRSETKVRYLFFPEVIVS
jgi:hypothetical protein